MKKKYILSFLAIILSFFTYSQNIKKDIKEIRKSYKEIVKSKDSYIKKSTDLMGGSSEGGQAIAYFKKNTIPLIEVTWYGEMGKTSRSFYFKNKQVFFIFEQVFTYNAPIYYDKETAKENNDPNYFNDKKTTVSENRYYFKNEKIIKWLAVNKKKQNITLKENKEVVNHLLKEAWDLKNKFSN